MTEVLLIILVAAVLVLLVLQGAQLLAVRAAGRAQRELPRQVRDQLDASAAQLRQDLSSGRQELAQSVATGLQQASDGTQNVLRAQTETLGGLRESFERQIAQLTQTNEQKLEALRGTMENKLAAIQQDNNARLEKMRETVEEKLQSTLERRLGESFKIVSENLQQVHVAMGEMRKLAGEVGSLQTLMSNVKNRGGWGEYQLAAILEQFLSPEQYAKNVQPGGTREVVEFAIKLPGRDEEGTHVWLPIDAKFPKEDYEKLIAASEKQDLEHVRLFSSQLEARIKGNAKEISQKYLHPPHTTDFGIMFLPTEGLYAEVLRRPGLADFLQREHRVIIAGPTTLVALLNSLQIGFRTLAIEKRSSEVWKVLGAVKAQFGTFGEVLAKVQKKLQSATTDIESVGSRTRTMQRKLREVETVTVEDSQAILGLAAQAPDELTEEGDEAG